MNPIVKSLIIGLGLSAAVVVNAGEKLLTVKAIVDGQPRKFQLDTGDNLTEISFDRNSANIPSVGTVKAESADGKSMACDLVRIAQLSFDSASNTDVQVQRCSGNQNLLGVDMLNGKVFELQFKSRKLIFLSAMPSDVQPESLNRTSSGYILLPFQIAGVSTTALFDSGWGVTAVSNKIIAEHPDSFTPKDTISDIAADGKLMQEKVYTASDIQIGSLHLKNQEVQGFDLPTDDDEFQSVDAVIGLSAMESVDWLFDLQENTWSWSSQESSFSQIFNDVFGWL